MENATKALLMAAGVLIGVMIISLGMALYSELEAYVEASNERLRANQINAFNTQFTKYLDYPTLTIHDVVSAANLAYENNISYGVREAAQITASRGNEATLYVTVNLGGNAIEQDIRDDATDLLNENNENKYECTVEISRETGRVFRVNFTQVP